MTSLDELAVSQSELSIRSYSWQLSIGLKKKQDVFHDLEKSSNQIWGMFSLAVFLSLL